MRPQIPCVLLLVLLVQDLLIKSALEASERFFNLQVQTAMGGQGHQQQEKLLGVQSCEADLQVSADSEGQLHIFLSTRTTGSASGASGDRETQAKRKGSSDMQFRNVGGSSSTRTNSRGCLPEDPSGIDIGSRSAGCIEKLNRAASPLHAVLVTATGSGDGTAGNPASLVTGGRSDRVTTSPGAQKGHGSKGRQGRSHVTSGEDGGSVKSEASQAGLGPAVRIAWEPLEVLCSALGSQELEAVLVEVSLGFRVSQ